MERMEDKNTIRGLKVVLILAALFTGIALLFHLLYSLPFKDSFLWYLGVFFCFYIPGNLLLSSLDFNKDEYFVNFFHSIALGTALIPLIYTIIRRISRPELIYIFVTITFLIWLICFLRDFKKVRVAIYTSYQDILSALVFITVIFLMLHVSYFTDIVFLENGFKMNNTKFTETEFHLELINMLRDVFPPLYPYASGFDFSQYHLNMHLEIEMFNRLFSIDTLKLTFFYFPLLYFCLLVFVPYIFVCKYMKTRFLGILVGMLMFCSDFSYIPGLIGMLPSDFPWNLLFNPTMWSLLTLNSYLPSLFIMFLCILYLKKYFEHGKLLHLIVFAVLGYSAYGFKSSMGPHIMGASFLVGILSTVFIKDKKGKLLCAASALSVLAMAIDVLFFRGGTSNNIISIDLFNRFRESLGYLGVSNMPWFLYPVTYPLYFFAAFGMRIIGFYSLKYIFQEKYFDSTVVFLVVFAVLGYSISEMIFLGFPNTKVNNAMWFSFQTLMASWLLLPYYLLRIRNDAKKYWSIIVLIVFLSAPATVQFLSLRSNHSYITVNSNALEVTKYLENTPPKSVVLHSLEIVPSIASNLSGRSSVLSLLAIPVIIGTIGVVEGQNRLVDIGLFFDPNDAMRRSIILEKYNVNYVLASSEDSKTLNKEPMLSQVFKNNEYVIYKVNRIK